MQNLIFTQLSIPEIRKLMREEFLAVLKTNKSLITDSPNENKKVFTFKEGCDYLNISKSHGYKLTSTNQIGHSKRGKKIYFTKEQLDKWILDTTIKTDKEVFNEELSNAEKYLASRNKKGGKI